MSDSRVARILDRSAAWLALGLRRNHQPFHSTSPLTLGLLFLPALLFGAGLTLAPGAHPRLDWPSPPWQLGALTICGMLATLGGIGDWWFHKVYRTVGPNEHQGHLQALAGGSVVFGLMALASVSDRPQQYLIAIQIAVMGTAALICHDEFVFHTHRCVRLETIFHRMLVFGNTAAFLFWMHWLYQT